MIKKITHIGWYEWRLDAKIFKRSYWKKRNNLAKALEMYGFSVTEYDNPWRLNATKDGEDFTIDCADDNIFPTDHGNRNSKYTDMMDGLINYIYVPEK